jgi:hypothetical protein
VPGAGVSVPSLASALRAGVPPLRLEDAKCAALTIARAADDARATGVFTQAAVLELRDLSRRALLLALWLGEARARAREIDAVFAPNAEQASDEAPR